MKKNKIAELHFFFLLQHMEYMFFQENIVNVKRCKTSAILKLSQGKLNINN